MKPSRNLIVATSPAQNPGRLRSTTRLDRKQCRRQPISALPTENTCEPVGQPAPSLAAFPRRYRAKAARARLHRRVLFPLEPKPPFLVATFFGPLPPPKAHLAVQPVLFPGLAPRPSHSS